MTCDQMRKGSTELVILSLLMERPMYGYEISQQLEQRSRGYFEMKEGLLYPALHRMQNGWLISDGGDQGDREDTPNPGK
jgi:DNA-binding PadR family transcriptional regulator